MGLKKRPKKNLCISVKSVGQNFHRISRMNRKADLLIRLLTDLRGYLAAGQWLAPDMCCCCFLVTQISLMTQIFLRGRVWSHRFHRFTQIFYGISGESLCPISGGICNDRTGRLCEIPCHPMTKKICVICEICVT